MSFNASLLWIPKEYKWHRITCPHLTSLSIGGNSLTVLQQQECLIMKYTIVHDDILSLVIYKYALDVG